MSVRKRLYLNCRSFVLNLLDIVGLATVLMPRWVVHWRVLFAVSMLIPHVLASLSGVIRLRRLALMYEIFIVSVKDSVKLVGSKALDMSLNTRFDTDELSYNARVCATLNDMNTPGLGTSLSITSPLSSTILFSCSENIVECGSHSGDSAVRLIRRHVLNSCSVGFLVSKYDVTPFNDTR